MGNIILKNKILVKLKAKPFGKANLYRNLNYHLPVPTENTMFDLNFYICQKHSNKSESNNFEVFCDSISTHTFEHLPNTWFWCTNSV